MAEAASRLKDEFLATVSHELRTPLNSILGWASLIDNRTLDQDTLKQAHESILRNAKTQERLVSDLLDASRIISGKMSLEMQNLDLAPVLHASLESIRAAAQAKAIRIETDIPLHTGTVLGDMDRLQQVFWNLLSNAVKFTPSGGRISIESKRSDSEVEVIVSDTGDGISPNFLPYIFDRFRQQDASITRKYGGLGLGLAIVRHLVELQGGTVSAESDGESRGATFRVRLPLVAT
jgi:signal transduction histidine kinase